LLSIELKEKETIRVKVVEGTLKEKLGRCSQEEEMA
jgi:hypothetical protein